ncbi:hypothetical protein [Saccharopolyspora gregorii]|uniref:Uncharacterized protein n=1 Tax=Saccharopolyspora gregorii TaxID=33914 RepID=A0ABP6S331_9PSEU
MLWTDVPRSQFEQAAAHTGPMRRTIRWRRSATCSAGRGSTTSRLLNLDEVSNAENPLLGHEFTANERAKMTPAGSAGASDILRPALVHEFGGAYLDGDNALADVSSLFDVVLDGREGYALHVDTEREIFSNSAVAAARHHRRCAPTSTP